MQTAEVASSATTEPVIFFGRAGMPNPAIAPKPKYIDLAGNWANGLQWHGRDVQYFSTPSTELLDQLLTVSRVAEYLAKSAAPLDKAIVDAVNEEFWNLL